MTRTVEESGGAVPYLHALLTATEESRVCQFQCFLGLCTFLSVILQPAKLPFIYGQGLKSLLRAQIALKQPEHKEWQHCSRRGSAGAYRHWRANSDKTESMSLHDAHSLHPPCEASAVLRNQILNFKHTQGQFKNSKTSFNDLRTPPGGLEG